MQELMSRHKTYSLTPRDCLKTTLFQKWQRMVAPPDTTRPPNKRRKRKSSTNAGSTTNSKKKNNQNNMSPVPPPFTLATQVKAHLNFELFFLKSLIIFRMLWL